MFISNKENSLNNTSIDNNNKTLKRKKRHIQATQI